MIPARLPLLLELLVRIQPRAFRDRYGEAEREMLLLRHADAKVRGGVGYARFWMREVAGLLASAWRERRKESVSVGRSHRSSMLHEFRHAARRLSRAPGFTISSVAMLGLGLGASATVFTLLNAVVLRPLPYPEADRLVWLDHAAPGIDLTHDIGITTWLSRQYSQSSRQLEDIALGQQNAGTLTEPGSPAELLAVVDVTVSGARVLGIEPLLGRWFVEGERGAVVLSEGLWRRRFGADRSIVGRTIRLNAIDYEVVGVMPAHFALPTAGTALWRPADYPSEHNDIGFNYFAIGRMRPGATLASLRVELQQLIGRSPEAFSAHQYVGHIDQLVEEGRIQALPQSLQARTVGEHGATLWMLMGAVVLVLITAWANVANLFVVRADARQREVAVRRALGSGRAGTVRFYLAEALLVALAGGAVGALLAPVAVKVILALPGVHLPRTDTIAFDTTSVGLTLTLSLLVGMALAAIPLLKRDEPVASVLRDEGRSATAGRARLRFRAALMAGQVALALMLLAAAGLLLRSYAHVRAADPGFATGDVLFFDISLPRQTYPERDVASAFHARLLDRVAAMPGVESAGMATCVPLDGYCWGESLVTESETPAGSDGPVVSLRRVSPGYFDALQLRIIEGRALEANETRADVVVLGEEAARRLFPGGGAVGSRVTPDDGGPESQWFTVVGVAADVATHSVMERAPEAAVYLPIRNTEDGTVTLNRMMFILRTAVDPVALLPSIRDAVRELDADIAVSRARTLDNVLAAGRANVLFSTMLLGIAGAVALMLGALGIYAVFSYVVGRRTMEIGVRLALGASARDVAALVLRQAATVTAMGALLGLLGAAALTRTMSALLFGVEPLDAGVFAASTLLLLIVAFAAAAIPARRAWRLRPVEALRSG